MCDRRWDRRRAEQPGANHDAAIRGIVVDETYDWEGDQPLQRRAEQLIIYELHVGGFTRHASSGVARPGTFAGLAEKIPYLQELGITHVELMPIMAFDAQDVPPGVAALGLNNYWGYSTIAYFAPHLRYATGGLGRQVLEFKEMVKALHRAGLEVILCIDVQGRLAVDEDVVLDQRLVDGHAEQVVRLVRDLPDHPALVAALDVELVVGDRGLLLGGLRVGLGLLRLGLADGDVADVVGARVVVGRGQLVDRFGLSVEQADACAAPVSDASPPGAFSGAGAAGDDGPALAPFPASAAASFFRSISTRSPRRRPHRSVA